MCIRDRIFTATSIGLPTSTSVSYTHLDVYKRQVEKSCAKLAVNNLIEIAKRIIPKTFLKIIKVASPIFSSKKLADFRTIYTKIVFKIIPTIILTT